MSAYRYAVFPPPAGGRHRLPRRVVTFVLGAVLAFLSGAVQSGDLPDTVERVEPSIVAVGTYQATRSPRAEYKGTGFVVGTAGWWSPIIM